MRKRQTDSGSRCAFTLLELLLVLTLMAISMATVVPQLNGTLGRWQLREGVRDLQATLQLAAQWALARQEPVACVLDVQRRVFTLRYLQAGQSTYATLPAISQQSLGASVVIARLEGFRDVGKEKALIFRPDGTSQAATILLAENGADSAGCTQWQISVDGQGTVQLQEKLADEQNK
jgi:type II secretion system protein H